MGQQLLTDRQHGAWHVELDGGQTYSLAFLFICGVICLWLNRLGSVYKCLSTGGGGEGLVVGRITGWPAWRKVCKDSKRRGGGDAWVPAKDAMLQGRWIAEISSLNSLKSILNSSNLSSAGLSMISPISVFWRKKGRERQPGFRRDRNSSYF